LHAGHHAVDVEAAHARVDRRPNVGRGRPASPALVRLDPAGLAALALRRLRRTPAQDALGAARWPHDHRARQRPLPVVEAPRRRSRPPRRGARHVSRRLTRRQIWGAPIALAVLSVVGLVSGMLADGLADVVSWLALATP